jgi:homoserine kinase type II
MSVYTVVTEPELVAFLGRYASGELRDFRGIRDGIENTNYYVSTTSGEFVLTLFEATPAGDLPFFLDLMAFLADRGIPSAHPVADRCGVYLQRLKQRPAALVRRLDGASVECPTIAQCREIGATIGRMHVLTENYSPRRASDRGARWRLESAARVRPRLEPSDRELLDREIASYREAELERLPQGVIHADLFRDNALFVGDRLSGIIDFYYAHSGALIYDLAVTVSDWCYASDGVFDLAHARAIVSSYRRQRAVSRAERAAWVSALRAAGLRFWLSRLNDLHFPRAGCITHTKDPAEFRRVLLDCEARREPLVAVWDE